MAKRARNFAAEYARRIRNATARGLTKSQARGHPGPAQNSALIIRTGAKPAKVDWTLEAAIKEMHAGATLSAAARQARVGRERLAAYAKRNAGAIRKGGTWTFDDRRARRVIMAETGEHNFSIFRVPGRDPASLAGQHYAEGLAVLENPNLYPAFVEKWAGVSIPDVKGKIRFFETDLNALFRMHNAEEVDWTLIYQIEMAR